MALLQVANPKAGNWKFHPLAVSPDIVASVVFSPKINIFIEEDTSGSDDTEYSVVTFKKPICVEVILENGEVIKKMADTVLVTGHFQEVSIALGLDTHGEIQEDIDLRNCY